MRRRLGYLAALLSFSLVAAGCSNESGSGSDVLIGVNIEQTGISQLLGSSELKAIQLTADEINAKGGVLGRKIRLVVKDNRSDPVESRRLVGDLIDTDKVVGIVGAGTTAATLPFVDVVEERKVPTISMGAADAIVANKRYVFRTPPDGINFVAVMMQDLVALGVKRIGLMAVGDQYGDGAVQAVTIGSRQANIELASVERFNPKDRDYAPEIAKLLEAEPEAILVAAIMPSAGIVAKNLKQAGYTGRVYFDGGAGAELFVAGAGKAAENMFMVHSSILAANQITATTPSTLAQKEFFVKYTQRHGTYSGYASYSADALNLMVEAIRKADSTDREKVRDALETLSYDGLTGSFQFSPSNHGGASADGLTVLTVRNGGWVLAQ